MPADCEGQRVDNFLFSRCKNSPKALIYKLLRKGQIRVDGKRAKCHSRLLGAQKIRIPPALVATSALNNGSTPAKMRVMQRASGRLQTLLAKQVVFEDTALLVVNKPAGYAVHGGSGISAGVIEAVRLWRPEQPYVELIHRLDKDTSGCLLLAKKRSCLRRVHEALRDQSVQKSYVLLVVGHWPDAVKKVTAPLKRNLLKSGERLVKISDEGRPSETAFTVLKRFETAVGPFTYVQANPKTGRTHQIRVHAQSVGCPIVGDVKYGIEQSQQPDIAELGLQSRLWLHCEAMTLPAKMFPDYTTFYASVDEHWQKSLKRLHYPL